MKRIVILILFLFLIGCSGADEVQDGGATPLSSLGGQVVSTEAVQSIPSPEPTQTATVIETATIAAPAATVAQPTLTQEETQLKIMELSQRVALTAMGRTLGRGGEEVLLIIDALIAELGVDGLPDLETAVPLNNPDATDNYLEEAERILTNFAETEVNHATAGLVKMLFAVPAIQIIFDPGNDISFVESMHQNLSEGAVMAGLPTDIYLPVLAGLTEQATHEEMGQRIDELMDSLITYVREGNLIDQAVAEEARLPLIAYFSMCKDITTATMGHALGANPEVSDFFFTRFQSKAAEFDVVLPNLLETVPHGDYQASLSYFFDARDALSATAEELFGRPEASLTDLILTSGLISSLYAPGSDSINADFVEEIARLSNESGIPEAIYMPSVMLINADSPFAEVSYALDLMQLEINSYLLVGELHPTVAELPSYADDAPSFALFWVLGRNFGTASMGRAISADEAVVNNAVEIYEAVASLIFVTFPEYDESTGDDAIGYMITAVTVVTNDITNQYGTEEAALFRLGVFSVVTNLLYDPADEELLLFLIEELSSDVQGAGIPDELFTPVLTALVGAVPKAELSSQIDDMLDLIDAYLAAKGEG